MTIKWHKLLNESNESRVAHYEVMIPASPHSEMGYGAFVEYHRNRGCEFKDMILHIHLNGRRTRKCFECDSFEHGKSQVKNYVSKVINNIKF